MLDPTTQVAENPFPKFVCGDVPSKNVLIQLTLFNKDKHMAKSIFFLRDYEFLQKKCNN
jgi:hypothetical protein